VQRVADEAFTVAKSLAHDRLAAVLATKQAQPLRADLNHISLSVHVFSPFLFYGCFFTYSRFSWFSRM
jgi:hypothetical protein